MESLAGKDGTEKLKTIVTDYKRFVYCNNLEVRVLLEDVYLLSIYSPSLRDLFKYLDSEYLVRK